MSRANPVKQVVEGGKSPAWVARELDVVPSVLASWVKPARAELGAPEEGAQKHAEREELTRLRKERRTWSYVAWWWMPIWEDVGPAEADAPMQCWSTVATMSAGRALVG